MLSVAEALERIVAHAGRQRTVRCSLREALGLVLAEPVASDLDSPPFDKSLMDGFAVRNADMSAGTAELALLGEIAAGMVVDRPLEPGGTYQIMTGAALPPGAEAVVVVEKSHAEGGRIFLEDPGFKPGQNVMRRGEEMKRDQVVLEPGALIGPPEVGLLAAVGRTEPLVHARPTVAVLSTGDEIVPPAQKPGPGQIRNSNESTLLALSARDGMPATSLGIVKDDEAELSERIEEGLKFDLLLLTGGVSAGKRDLVPATLGRHGVQKVLHHVAFKPGKPIWFGIHQGGLVFGLPGNPVSVLVCYELFVRTALRARQGRQQPLPIERPANLAVDFHYPTGRPTYHPARVEVRDGRTLLEPVDWFGSPDLRALSAANALVVLPAGNEPMKAGRPVSYLPLAREC